MLFEERFVISNALTEVHKVIRAYGRIRAS